MHPATNAEVELLSSSSTPFWKKVFPTAWTVGVGSVAAAAWMDLIGSPPAPAPVKILLLGGWAVFSILFFRWFGRLQPVWRMGDDLVIGDLDRGPRVGLAEIREVKETRMQRLKMVTLELRRPTPLGRRVTFVPKGAKAIWLPYAPSEVAEELRARIERLALPSVAETSPE